MKKPDNKINKQCYKKTDSSSIRLNLIANAWTVEIEDKIGNLSTPFDQPHLIDRKRGMASKYRRAKVQRRLDECSKY